MNSLKMVHQGLNNFLAFLPTKRFESSSNFDSGDVGMKLKGPN